jgi:hypothetical protein
MCGTAIYYWDPAQHTLRYHGVFSSGTTEEGTLLSEDGGDTLWRDRMVYGNGNQGTYRFKHSYDKATGTQTIGWSKISGSGGNEIGPWKFTRVKCPPASSSSKLEASKEN